MYRPFNNQSDPNRCRKVVDRGERPFSGKVRRDVGDATDDNFDPFSESATRFGEIIQASGREIIHNADPIATGKKRIDQMGSNEPCTAGDENWFGSSQKGLSTDFFRELLYDRLA